jgi:hypothetical protein
VPVSEEVADLWIEEATAEQEPDFDTLQVAPLPSRPTQDFRKGDRVITPKGEGEVLYFNEAWGEYHIAFDTFTHYFKPCELKPVPTAELRKA